MQQAAGFAVFDMNLDTAQVVAVGEGAGTGELAPEGLAHVEHEGRHFEVVDTGIGMSAAQVARIFDTFEQALAQVAPLAQQAPVAVHVTCSTQHLGEAQGLLDIVSRCTQQLVVPEGIHCCGFAGDKGFTTPELNAHALRSLKDAVQICEEGVSTSRTCEIGLSHHAGIDYHGLVYLVDRVTTARSAI